MLAPRTDCKPRVTNAMNVDTKQPLHLQNVRIRTCRIAAALTLAAAALAAAGCGGRSHDETASSSSEPPVSTGTRYVNSVNAERLIEQRIDAQRHQRVVVSCPPNVPLEAGHQLICRPALPGGMKVLVVVTVLDTHGRLRLFARRSGVLPVVRWSARLRAGTGRTTRKRLTPGGPRRGSARWAAADRDPWDRSVRRAGPRRHGWSGGQISDRFACTTTQSRA
jgi:hypothetical protein